MALKTKEEAPAPPKTEAKAKALKAEKAVLKGVHSHTHKNIYISPAFLRTRKPQPNHPWKRGPGRNKLDRSAVIKFPTTESTMRKTEDSNTLEFIEDVKAINTRPDRLGTGSMTSRGQGHHPDGVGWREGGMCLIISSHQPHQITGLDLSVRCNSYALHSRDPQQGFLVRINEWTGNYVFPHVAPWPQPEISGQCRDLASPLTGHGASGRLGADLTLRRRRRARPRPVHWPSARFGPSHRGSPGGRGPNGRGRPGPW
ncbi:hypothetical protein HPG69_017646 [Diceros bicornis minor]|uniref:Large ribosomal subunit protein uL23 N-terminal domain-containing protein n=1 Tax=Diceros bicornis minor TaxID=77932 RepID=A0A7J7FKA8_DICBM|nr:hypothetical protein HPG69_017646 [Diceros bicornis minor]